MQPTICLCQQHVCVYVSCRGSKLGDCPPLVLASLLAGAGPGTSAAQLDALQQQLEESNGKLLRPLAGELVVVMLGDVLTPPERGGTAQVCLFAFGCSWKQPRRAD